MTGTANKLKTLFDLQRFEGESTLQNVIDDTINNSHRMRMLSDDELENAAGGVTQPGEGLETIIQAHCPECDKIVDVRLEQGSRGHCLPHGHLITGL